MLRTGLIQPETIPGQFPRNLRAIVELYRTCLDRGAEIVICPPLALGGMNTGELALRSGFRAQHQAAFEYLAREIAEVPLLLGAPDAGGIRLYLLRSGRLLPQKAVIPGERQEKNSAPAAGLFRGKESGEFTVRPVGEQNERPSFKPCLLLRMPAAPWHEGQLEQDEEESRRLALETALPVATVRLAGGEGPFMLPGASSLWSGTGELAARLQLFERDAAVIPAETPADRTAPLPAPDRQTRHALRKGIADFILKAGCGSACLNLLENASSSLLVHVLKKSLPDLPVTGFIPRLSGTPEKDIARAEHLAAGLGIRTISLPPMSEVQPGSAEEGCLSACRMRALADEEGALLLSSLNGTDITTDLRAIRAACTADFMPLKDLYESELAALFPEIRHRITGGGPPRRPAHAPAQGACVRHAPGGSHAGPGTGNTQVAEAGPYYGMGPEKTAARALPALHSRHSGSTCNPSDGGLGHAYSLLTLWRTLRLLFARNK